MKDLRWEGSAALEAFGVAVIGAIGGVAVVSEAVNGVTEGETTGWEVVDGVDGPGKGVRAAAGGCGCDCG